MLCSRQGDGRVPPAVLSGSGYVFFFAARRARRPDGSGAHSVSSTGMGATCAEHGYLLVPRAERELAASIAQAAYTSAAAAVEIGERFADADLIACARHIQGRALLQQGQVEQGLALLDEAMVAVVAGELSPLMTGLIYCSVIDSCMQVYAFARAREWTFALSRWCDGQPQLVAFTGTCLVHRAEIMELHGAWPDAIEEAQRACSGFARSTEQQPPAAAFYRRGELCRLQGEFAAAEEAYREASRRGFEPQPGLGPVADGPRSNGCRRRLRSAARSTPQQIVSRARGCFLPASRSCLKQATSRRRAVPVGNWRRLPRASMPARWAPWRRTPVDRCCWRKAIPRQRLSRCVRLANSGGHAEAPYLTARTRELIGLACRALGDEEGAELELEAARAAFHELGAAPDIARIASHAEDTRLGAMG